jgi:hypothetical protein
VVVDFNLELAVAMLMHEESFAMAVLEIIIPVVMPAMVIEEDVVAAVPAVAGVIEQIIRAAAPTMTEVVGQVIRPASPTVTAATAAGTAATTLGQQDGTPRRRLNLSQGVSARPESDPQHRGQNYYQPYHRHLRLFSRRVVAADC